MCGWVLFEEGVWDGVNGSVMWVGVIEREVCG